MTDVDARAPGAVSADRERLPVELVDRTGPLAAEVAARPGEFTPWPAGVLGIADGTGDTNSTSRTSDTSDAGPQEAQP